MAALANILAALSYEVVGLDYKKHFFTEDTLDKKIKVLEFDSFSFDPEYTYIIGNVFKTHDYAKMIQEKKGKYYYYADFLASFFSIPMVAISGTHGKTTVTSFVHQISAQPLLVLIGDGTGFGTKHANYFVVEACEYRDTFLAYHPRITLINNIEHDHPDYFDSVHACVKSFQKLADQTEILIINGDTKECRRITHPKKITFGFQKHNHVVMEVQEEQDGMNLSVRLFGKTYNVKLPMFGEHLAYDACAAAIVCYLMGDSKKQILKQLPKLTMPHRRTNLFRINDLIVVDDYAHHPTEIKTTLLGLQKQFRKKIVVCFQPHTYSRTNAFLDEFIQSLKVANEVYILDVFSSVREKQEADGALLKYTGFRPFEIEVIAKLQNRNDCIVVFMGAGDVNHVMHKTFPKLESISTTNFYGNNES